MPPAANFAENRQLRLAVKLGILDHGTTFSVFVYVVPVVSRSTSGACMRILAGGRLMGVIKALSS